MNRLMLVKHDGRLLADSREVAEMTGKRHDHLVRDIDGYMKYLSQNPNLGADNFFVDSEYKAGTGRYYKHYLLTRKGCDMVANKMTGEKGVLFTAEYVTRFEEMEQDQPKVLSEKEQLMASMKLSIEHDETLEQHDSRLTHLEETMRIDGAEEHRIKKKANAKIMEVIGGKKAPAYGELSRHVFSTFWRDFKNHFTIPRYGDLPKKQFEEGLRFIEFWQPDTSLRMEIESTNYQQSMREVI
ncbi:phage regulatory protein [Halobacillus halophilus]|uniref:Antirepressor n=1 Tax=Halobacillus halophilus (strain ATCC 35676 / DSM 2266 / JCM 20832 / KCTC 3685 / LMG 17431 / NBRC 102448 / NCIMB 2269) TaxID=866895 RepID=I0JIM5_HALH3|nr:phage regulatory protein [Halobacillus halophilus]ASF38176.1 phage regulatory protein [Halobacillus halophilus]CCG43993.1 putative antirepressor [Halobacillus halophilus DSM 2266]